MKTKKIHIIGAPGSGKSFVAKKLAKELEIKHYDLDDFFWTNSDYSQRTNPNKRNSKLTDTIKKESWIIEGIYYKWTEESFANADVICVLKPNVLLRDWRILTRYIACKLKLIKKRSGSFESLVRLIKWNHRFDKEHLAAAEKILKKYKSKVYQFSSVTSLKNFNL